LGILRLRDGFALAGREKSRTRNAMSRPRFVGLLLAVITLLVYLPATLYQLR
jgi:hypothetical protein